MPRHDHVAAPAGPAGDLDDRARSPRSSGSRTARSATTRTSGLISPERRGTQRVYHRRDRTRLDLILRGKRLGFPLEEIRTIIDLYDEQPGEAGQLEYLLGQIDDRRADLEQRRRDIEDALAELADFERRCEADLRARR